MSADKKSSVVTVDALRPDSRGVTLNVKVVDATVVLSRPRGPKGPVKVAECLVGDSTGVIVFTARNEQVDVAQKGATIALKNAKIDMFRGSMRLAVEGSSGNVEACDEDHDIKPNTQNNFSLIEFELVTLPTGPAS